MDPITIALFAVAGVLFVFYVRRRRNRLSRDG